MTATWERALPSANVRRALAWIIPGAALAFAVLVWPIPAPIGVVVNGALVGGARHRARLPSEPGDQLRGR